MSITVDDIRAARERIRPHIYHSPCPYSLSLSRLCDAEIYCKLDHLQMTGSFKERGARNRLMALSPEQRTRGVVAASAGNHALGLGYHGQLLGVPVTVVMPRWAPIVKVTNTRSFGATVIQHGESFDEALRCAIALAEERGLTFVSAYDDPHIIAGQGTLGLEILEDVPDVDAVIVPVGGGGLIAGVGTVVKALQPTARVIGVEPAHAASMSESLRIGRPTKVATQPTLADGLAVAEPGKLCFEIARQVIDNLLLVDEAQIALSILRLLELEKTVVEGAGAVPLAAAMEPSLDLRGRKVVLLLCGGNIDVTMISRVIERGLAADGRLCRFTVAISDRPGSLAALTAILAAAGASVKDISHDRHFGPADIARVAVTCLLETRDKAHIEQVKAALADANIAVVG
jgi:threonine dehydratase